MATLQSIPPPLFIADPDLPNDTVDEVLLAAEDNEEDTARYEISSYGADYDVDGLVKRLKLGDIKVPPFQRGYVWPIKQASRFIESLLLGLPVPGVFFSKELTTNKLLVIDGQQRLTTLLAFHEGIFPSTKKEFSLVDVQPELQGLTYKSLAEGDRRNLNDAIIHATVIKQTNPADGGSGIYKIFERLNSSGMLLSPQEIRTAIYSGTLSELLAKLNALESWRKLFGPVNKRMRDQELILRFCVFLDESANYVRPLKTFLSNYMNTHRDADSDMCKRLEMSFTRTVDFIDAHFGSKAFKPISSFNAAVFDAVAIGIERRLAVGEIKDPAAAKSAFDGLMRDQEFSQWTSSSTSDDEVVKNRLSRATERFKGVQ